MVATLERQPVTYAPRGAAKDLLESRVFEILIEGPVGTGKSFGVLWKMHLAALKYPGMRGILLRKTQKSLTESAIQTFMKILATHPANYGVKGFSGNIEEPRAFKYPNGSRLVVGGLDNAGKVMSAEYDLAAVFEATQITLEDVEALVTRLRNGVMPYQQLIMDCNPDAPTHWLNQRALDGKTTRLRSRHKDNPMLWSAKDNDWTEFGREYVVERLDSLTGVRRKRNLDGIWAAAEGQIFEEWDPQIHVIPRFDIPADWTRYWCIDFGYVHAFVWNWYAVDHDGRIYLYRQIYMSRRLVEDHAAQGLRLSANEPRPRAIITDHDAEDRATFERHTGMKTTAAQKNVKGGIQAVQERLRVQPDGKPRLFILEDSLVERDQMLKAEGRTTSTEEEFTSYVWDQRKSGVVREKEVPVKEDDHGMDNIRYMTAHLDLRKRKGLATA